MRLHTRAIFEDIMIQKRTIGKLFTSLLSMTNSRSIMIKSKDTLIIIARNTVIGEDLFMMCLSRRITRLYSMICLHTTILSHRCIINPCPTSNTLLSMWIHSSGNMNLFYNLVFRFKKRVRKSLQLINRQLKKNKVTNKFQ